MFVSDVLYKLREEWGVIRAAPWSVLFIAAVVGICGYEASSLHYQQQIVVLQSRIDDYKERLGLVPSDQSAYSKLTNQELRRYAVDLSRQMNTLQETINHVTREQQDAEILKVRAANTREEQDQIRQQHLREISAEYQDWQAEFNSKYRAKALILREEMVRADTQGC